jgi:hypothetical protein
VIIDNFATRSLLHINLQPGDLLLDGKASRFILSIENDKPEWIKIKYFCLPDYQLHKDELVLQCMLYYGCYIVRND